MNDLKELLKEKQKQQQIKKEYRSMTKNVVIAYVAFILLGFAGFHRFYLKKYWTGALMFVTTCILSHFIQLLAIITVLMMFFDLFTLGYQVKEFNDNAIEEKLNGKKENKEKEQFNLKSYITNIFATYPRTMYAGATLTALALLGYVVNGKTGIDVAEPLAQEAKAAQVESVESVESVENSTSEEAIQCYQALAIADGISNNLQREAIASCADSKNKDCRINYQLDNYDKLISDYNKTWNKIIGKDFSKNELLRCVKAVDDWKLDSTN